MKKALGAIGAGALIMTAAAPAAAHFKLEQPPDALVTDATGDPTGATGSQKASPCGTGTPSNAVTKVRAGAMLHVKLTETIPHGGHYRIALSSKRADFEDPVATVTSGQCISAQIESNPTAPVLVDGLFQHTQAQATANKVWETDVQMPSTPCDDCTLQVVEFMTPHGSPCFYYHCAAIQIVADDGADAGNADTDAGADGGVRAASSSTSSSGCSVGGGAPPSLVTLGIFSVIAISMFRRKRR
jgi:hypothetical protein